MTHYDQEYFRILKSIYDTGFETPTRDNHTVRGLPGQTMQIDLAKGFPALTLRKIPLKTFIAEMVWFVMGSNDADDFVNDYTSIWKEFMLDSAKYKRAPAYGHRWRHHFGRDQLQGLVEHLQKEPHSRHAVVVTWDPADDGLGHFGTPKYNIPCPYTFTVNIIDNRLHFHLVIRSNDIVLGNPHDVAGHAILAYMLAAKLGVDPGIMTTSISNAHYWDAQYDAAQALIERDYSNHAHPEIMFRAQPDYYDRAMAGDHTLVKEIFKQLNTQYNPMPKISMAKVVVGYEGK